MERYELNIIPNGKILVIDQLSVIKNTMKKPQHQSQSNSAKSNQQTTQQTVQHPHDHERNSIMNTNLAETLKSIGIIGSLKPTSNNSTNKKQSKQQPENSANKATLDQIPKKKAHIKSHTHKSNTLDTLAASESAHQNQLISNFNRRFKQQTFEFKQQYELIEQKFKQMFNSERKCMDYESSMSGSSSSNSINNTTANTADIKQKINRDKNNNSKDLRLGSQVAGINSGEDKGEVSENSQSEEENEDEDEDEYEDEEGDEDDEYDYDDEDEDDDEEDDDENGGNYEDIGNYELKKIMRFKAGYKKVGRV